jgi:hypothetical protein
VSLTAGQRQRLRRFKESLAADLYLPSDFIPWPLIEAEVAELRQATRVVDEFVRQPRLSRKLLAGALTEDPGVLQVFWRLLAAPAGAGFADGRELPRDLPRTKRGVSEVASLLHELGVTNLIHPNSRTEDLLRVALVAADSRKRGFRRSGVIGQRVWSAVTQGIQQAESQIGVHIGRMKDSEIPPLRGLDRRWVLAAEDVPIAAIVPVIQTSSGGRQQRDLSLTYPTLQADLDRVPISLVLIADGRGIAETPDTILAQLFESVAACMSLKEAESGALAAALEEAATKRGVRSASAGPLNNLIEGRLRVDSRVDAKALPVERDRAVLALAQYQATNPRLALELAADGNSLAWRRPAQVAAARALLETYEPTVAATLLGDLVGQLEPALADSEDLPGPAFSMSLSEDEILPEGILVATSDELLSEAGIRAVARESLHLFPEARLAVLLAPPPAFGEPDIRKLQPTLSASVVVIRPQVLVDMAQSARSARDHLVELVLEQADLAKASPYVLNSVTPSRIFYGREAEEAVLLATLPSNSVALLGGRRIGKTSLLRHAHARLEDAGFATYFGDCQTVRDWADFGQMAARRWDVLVPGDFTPEHLFDVVSQLARPGQGTVLLLDEIDQLLDWDQHHSASAVPEAFFRACRTLSQEGTAQFVFTGERTIATKLWDPLSPHWNFCRPLPLQQLDREAADALLARPLHALGIAIGDETDFLEVAWHRTSGHPQLVQQVGDRLIRLLNRRPPQTRGRLEPPDVASVTDGFDYREHYLETYWGQATSTERLMTVLVAEGGTASVPDLVSRLGELNATKPEREITVGLRMLDLYGVLRQVPDGYALRATWLTTALDAYGGVEATASRFVRESHE